ncbi:MAG: aldo/keto reductase [Candidatus Poribacteria bacterium]|nr:aldo/keto reductase [Candidatus Poribacteria bacterium]MDE0323087.1 aldo/keto reductase [Candidatus Poribacteria bacterium]
MIDRRAFLKSMASLTTGVLLSSACAESGGEDTTNSDRLGPLLPTRRLGRTGEAVTMLGIGGWHIGDMEEKEAQKTIETALEGGVRFIDSAESYQGGRSETRLGKLLVPKYRDDVFLMTKTRAENAEDAWKHLEGSLTRLNTDRLDLWQMHSVQNPADVNERINNGVLDVLLEAKATGKTRYIGFTGHASPAAHERVLEQTDIFDACQLAMNLVDVNYESFIERVVPILIERNIGIIGMKALANGGFFGGSQHGRHGPNPKVVPDRVSVSEAIRFIWSLPVSTLVTGPDNAEQMQEKIDIAKNFTGMEDDERQALIEKVEDMAGTTVEFYKA